MTTVTTSSEKTAGIAPPSATGSVVVGGEGGAAMFTKVAWLVLRKDVAIEAKTREILYTTLFFAVSCVLIFSFAFVRFEGGPPEDIASGILWIAIAFSGTLALGRTFERERYGETLKALLLAPAPRAAIYVGKLLGVVLLLGIAELLLVPLVALLFSAGLFVKPWLLVGLLATGTIGFCAVGTLFAAMLLRTRTRDVLLPILLYPIAVPVMIGGVRGTSALLASPPDVPTATMWLALLVFFDVIFVTLALWTFEPLMTE
jgi:heme exporter protein B